MLHMPCQMQEMHKGKLYICYKGAPTHQLKRSNKHQAPPTNEWKLLDLGVWWKYRLVGHVWVHGSKLSSLSLHCLSENDTSLLCAWFFAMLMALVLSHWSGTWVYSSPKSLMVYVIQRSWEQQLAAAMYFASVVDWATLDYLWEDQDTKEDPKNWQVLEVDFLSNRHLAKSASEKPWSAKEEDAEYQRPKSGVWCKSLETLENERTNIPRTRCLASLSSSRGVTRSCSGTPSSPRVHLPHPHQEL
jgi:hypothetical protein